MTKPINNYKNTLIIITGPTAVGKTQIAIDCAKYFDTEILSCDSRQFYREMNIGTAVPTHEQLKQVPHHFIQHKSIHDYYNVSLYESDALNQLNKLFLKKQIVIMTGGSGMYIETICNGIADLPDIDPEIRADIKKKYETLGLNYIQQWLYKLDNDYYNIVNLKNPQRIIRAIEVCIQSGQKYSKLRNFVPKNHPFDIKKICLTRNKDELHQRINNRVDCMIKNGLINEVENLIQFQSNNALKTVGYREFFDYFSGKTSLNQTIENIKTNTRRYAKRQITWFKRYNNYYWINLSLTNENQLNFNNFNY